MGDLCLGVWLCFYHLAVFNASWPSRHSIHVQLCDQIPSVLRYLSSDDS